MNARNAFNPDLEERAEFPKLKDRFGEDPARFLQSSKDLAKARIRGIRDPELLEAWRAVAKQILSGSDQTEALEYIGARERELTDAQIELEPTPVSATDGGTVTDSDQSEPTREPKGSEPDELHPDTKSLAAGEVLVLETADRPEFIFPATPQADAPFLLRAIDAEGHERTDEPIGLTFDEVAYRLDGEHDPRLQSEIDVYAPALAAASGGEGQ